MKAVFSSLPQFHKALWPILWQFECITLIPHGSGSVTGSNTHTPFVFQLVHSFVEVLCPQTFQSYSMMEIMKVFSSWCVEASQNSEKVNGFKDITTK